MEYLIILLFWALIVASTVAVNLHMTLKRERREWEYTWAHRSVGNVVSSEVTSDGVEVQLEITDQDTWDKINWGVMGGVSIDEAIPTHHPSNEQLDGVVVDGLYVPPHGLYGVKGMKWGVRRNGSPQIKPRPDWM